MAEVRSSPLGWPPSAEAGKTVQAESGGGNFLSEQECWELLGSQRVGRVAYTVNALPAVLPVSYQLVDWFVVFFMAVERELFRAMAEAVVAFEVGEVERGAEPLWSVNAVGRCFPVRDRTVVEEIAAGWPSAGSAGGTSRLLALRPEFISRRRFGG